MASLVKKSSDVTSREVLDTDVLSDLITAFGDLLDDNVLENPILNYDEDSDSDGGEEGPIQLVGSANNIKIPGYKELTQTSSEFLYAIQNLSDTKRANTYHDTLMKFQGQGSYSKLRVSYGRVPYIPSPPGKITTGKVVISVRMQDSKVFKPVMKDEGEKANLQVDIRKVEEVAFQVLICTSEATMTEGTIYITLIHELMIHLEPFAKIMTDYSLTFHQRLGKLFDQSAVLQHSEAEKSDSPYETAVKELLEYFKDYQGEKNNPNRGADNKRPLTAGTQDAVNSGLSEGEPFVNAPNTTTYNSLVSAANAGAGEEIDSKKLNPPDSLPLETKWKYNLIKYTEPVYYNYTKY